MKYCEEYAAALSAFADGELSGGEADVLRAHLASCPGCRAYLADLRAMQAAFPPMETAPADFAAGVMARIHGGTAKPRSRRRLYPLLGAVAVCLVLLVAVGLFPAAPPTAPSAAPPQAAQEAPRMRDTANEFAIADGNSAPALVDSAPAPADTAPESAATPADTAPVDSAPAPVTAPGNPGETAVGIAGGSAPANVAPPMVQAAAMPVYFATLELTEKQAGELLLGYTALPAPEGSLRYELPRDAFDALLAALPDVVYTPGDENAALALVTVTAGT